MKLLHGLLPLNAAFLLLSVWWLGRRAAAHPAKVTAALTALFLFDACGLLWLVFGVPTLASLALAALLSSLLLPESFTRPLTDALGRLRFPLFLASTFTLAALQFVVLPITTFLTSPGELEIHFEYLLSHSVQQTMAVVYGAAALYGMAMFSRMRTMLSVGAFATLLAALLYAYVLPFGYPRMNGLMFEQIPVSSAELTLRSLADAFVVPAVAAGVVLGLRRFGARSALVGVLLLDVSLLFASGAGVLRGLVSTGTDVEHTDTTAQPIRFNKQGENVLLLFLDRFMGGYVEEILAAEPALAARLDGFTWYPRTVAAGENSIAGLHPLLGGYDYTPVEMNKRGKPLRDVAVESYAILPLNFTKHGWTAQLLNPRGLGFTMEGDCSFLPIEGLQCSSVPASVVTDAATLHGMPRAALSKASYSDLLVLLGLMRSTPYIVKGLMSEKGPWQRFLDHSAGTTFKQWAELDALPRLTRTDGAANNLNIVFNMLPHEPYFMGEDCLPRRTRLEVPEAEAKARGYASLFDLQHAVAARCTLLLVASYLDWMKQQQIYDNTKIVLVSDHGIAGPVEDRSSRALRGQTRTSDFVRFRSMLMVKPRGARGPMATSEEFLPNAEVPRILCEELGGCVNPYLADKPIEALGRDDPFHVVLVPWQFNLQKPDAFDLRSRWTLTGKDPYALGGWAEVK